MREEKQIEEMAKVIDGIFKSEFGVNFNDDILAKIAELLYDADCRKRSEVAREIFEEIERETKNHGITYAQRKIAELKKKYTGEQT